MATGNWTAAGSASRKVAMAILFSLAVAGLAQADPDLPIIPSRTTNLVLTAGGTDNAGTINGAITTISSLGGGTVEISSNSTGPYLSGPITMQSSVNLQIDAGAMLQMLPMSIWTNLYGSTTFILGNGSSLHDMEITGGGTIDGQGAAWWSPKYGSRPNFIEFDHASRILIQGVTLQNPPTFHIYVKNSNGNLTIQNITINTVSNSPNTDGIDLASTNVLIRNCYISDGDDNIEIGSGSSSNCSALAANITVSNCTFGTGHGVSIGSDTACGVNNLLVSNCWWNGTEYGIHGKTDTDRGGTIQNLVYRDLTMSNVNFAIAFYSHYGKVGAPQNSFTFTPQDAATTVDTGTLTPSWQNITVSNLTVVGIGGNVAGFFWGLPQSPITNVTLSKVNISPGTNTLCMYDVRGLQIIDSNLTVPNSSTNTLTIYDAQFTITNSAPNTTNTVTITGLGSPSNSVLSLFNGQAETTDASVLGANPLLTLAGSTLTVSNNASLGGSSTLNYGLGTNATETIVTGNLTLGGTLNVANFDGFTNTTYTLFTYGGTLTYNGLTVGTKPNASFTYTVSTNTAGQVNLIVASPCSVGAAGSITGSASVNAGANGVTYSISSVSGATTYTWAVPTGASVASGQGTTSITVNYACSANSGSITVTPSNGSCSGTPANLSVTVTGVAAAGPISGPSAVCASQAGEGYSISSVSGATTYTWAVPAGATITSGQGTTSITVTWGSVAGSVQVTPSNANSCAGTVSSLSVAVIAAPGITSNPSPQSVCAGGMASFTVSASGAGLSYQWQKNGSNIGDGGTISGSGTITLTLTGAGTVDSGASFDCVVSGTCSPPATSGAATLTVNANPATFSVTGGGSACPVGDGVTVGLDGSESTADYQLEVNGNPTGAPVAGTGSAISFANQTAAGTYTIIASNVTSGCTATMNGSASVSPADPFACWQLQYFGSNNCALCAGNVSYTGDGMSNTNKFLAGFSPTNSAAYLRISSVARSGTNVIVTYLGASGDTNYVPGVQSRTNVLDFTTGGAGGNYTNGGWQDTFQTNILGVDISAAGGEGTGLGTVTNMTDIGGAASSATRYYRVRVVP
ncbi:MAG: glycosyl hydrolase family 28 protein [Verrucomicrobiia bacterium]